VGSRVRRFYYWRSDMFDGWDGHWHAGHSRDVMFEEGGLLDEFAMDFGRRFLDFNFLDGFNWSCHDDTAGRDSFPSLKLGVTKCIGNLKVAMKMNPKFSNFLNTVQYSLEGRRRSRQGIHPC